MPQVFSLPFKERVAHPLAGATVLQIIPDLEVSPPARAAIEIAAALAAAGAIADGYGRYTAPEQRQLYRAAKRELLRLETQIGVVAPDRSRTVIDLEHLARHAVSLDGVRERVTGGRRGWYWNGRLVARQQDDESVVVRCAFDERERLLLDHPETFSVPPRLESHQKVLVDLLRGQEDVALAAVTAAWVLQRDAR